MTPTIPVSAAGWRIDPPVSVPIASGASNAATAAADPPLDPPGVLVKSQGFCVVPYAEFSVDEPIANSSIFVLPRITTPAAFNFATTVESYGGRQPSRIFDPAVVGIPFCARISLTAIGTPASGESFSPLARFLSIASACSKAPALSICKKALILPSTAAIRSKCCFVSSTEEISFAASALAISAAVE